MVDILTKQIEKLNKSEKLLLVEALWDSIASEPEDVPLPEHHKSVLDERLKTLVISQLKSVVKVLSDF